METIAQYAPVIGLLFFFTVFVGIAVWALRPSMKKQLQTHAEIPLKENK